MKSLAILVALLVVCAVAIIHRDGFTDDFASRADRVKITRDWLAANPAGTYAEFRRDVRGNILDFYGM